MAKVFEKIKKTRQRVQIIEALEHANRPLSAEELFGQCRELSLSTVYRTLERLCGLGVVEKQVLSDDGRAVFLLRTEEHEHFAICLSCHEKTHLKHCPLQDPGLDGFSVTGHRIEVFGYCAKCREQAERS